MVALGPVGQVGVPFVPGTMLGKFELLATIGTGGMASVLLARQRGPAGFEKVVVLKVIHAHMAQDPIAINMLLDEARVAAQIEHQNVVHTYELGEAQGTYYIAMEYLAGESFAQVLKRASRSAPTLDPYLASRIVADAAEGLHAAHELKDLAGNPIEVVHRDVSPGNIVVLYKGGVKVVDFGIAKAHGRVTSTQDGELKGKYGYMAPEQIRNEPMDRRSDVFSLGVVLWEALALRRLFQADSVGATLMQILSTSRTPPSEHRPAVPAALDAVALKALSPDPRDRYQTAAAMKQAIEDVIWQTRYGAVEIERHMTTLFADRMEQRRTLLAQVSREALSATDLATLGAAFQEPVSSRGQPSPAVAHSPTAPAVPSSPMAPRSAPSAMTARPSLPALPMAPPMQLREPRHPPKDRRIAIVLAAGLVVGVVAALAVGFVGGDADAPASAEPAVAVGGPAGGPAELAPTAVEVAAPEPTEVPTPTITEIRAEPGAASDPGSDSDSDSDSDPASASPPELPAVAITPTPTPVTRPEPVTRPTPVTRPEPTPRPEPVKRPRGSADEQARRGTERYLAGDFRAAEAAYKQAIAIDRGFAPAYRGLGFLYQRTGSTTKAIEALRTYLRLSPNAKDGAAVRKRLQQLGGA